MNAIALSPEQFIFAQGEELKTSSLKVAERFGKRHDNVIRDIDKILPQVSDIFGKLNFEETEYEQKNNLGLMVKYRSFNLTKDGFMFLVMSFTGKEAAAIKEWYINAFNLMYNKLFPKTQYGLKQLPPSPYISESEAAQFMKSVKAHCKFSGEKYGAVYEKVYGYYGITSYKNIPTGKLEEAARLCGMKLLKLVKPKIPEQLPTDDLLHVTPLELDALVAERIKAIEGEIMPKQENHGITINLAPLTNKKSKRWLVTQSGDETVTMMSIGNDQEIMSREGFIRELRQDSNYIVFDKTGLSARQIVMHYIPPKFLPDLIEEAWAMLRRTDAGKLQA